jgi:hypothetical protein
MAFVINKATREKIFIKVALMAPSGGGKTFSALRLATGMAEEFKKLNGRDAKILMGNTEAARGRYYANEFKYDIVDIGAPHNPEKYVEFIEFAESEGYDILILDSSSHEWEGKGGCLELQQQAGGTYQAWGKITPRHDRFINALADSKMHVIATMRGKDQYEVNKNDSGKTTVTKLGVGAKQRDGFEYEFTCTFLIDQKTNMAETQKDNTHLFEHEGAVLLSENHGIKLMQWANSGEGFTPVVRNDKSSTPNTTEPTISTKDVKAVIAKIDVLAKEKAAIDKVKTFDKIKEFAKDKNSNPTANYNVIKDIDTANKLLEALTNLEVQ